MKRKFFVVTVSLLFLALIVPNLLQAQVRTGTLRGFVTDAAQTALPGVTIEIESASLMQPRSMITDDRGFYRFLYLPPGTYTICARLDGFDTCWTKGVSVQSSSTASANVVMNMGGLEETIVVTAEAPVIDTESSDKTYNIKLEMLMTIPIAPRMNFDHIWYTLPGVIGHGTPMVNAAMTFQPPDQHWQDDSYENKVVIDGIEINDAMSGSTYGKVNYESIQEMDVKTAGASAEYGNARSAFMNIITKSGGNEFQGSAFFEWQPQSFNTTNVEEGEANKISFAVPALTVSGPILHDKLWFLLSYKYDNEDYVYPDTVVEPEIIRETRAHLPYAKLTWQANPNHTISGMFSSDTIEYANRGFPSVRYSTLATEQYRVDGGPTANMTWRWIINDSTYFNFVSGFNHGPRDSFARNQVPRDRYTERFQGGSTLKYDNGYGEDYWSVRENFLISGDLTKFVDNLWNTGAHEFKFGVDIRPYQHATRTRKYWEDTFGGYRYRWGLDYANYGLSEPYVYRAYAARGAPGTAQDRYDNEVTVSNQNLYLQDSWVATKSLTIHLGVRFEHQQEYMHFREELPDELLAIYPRMQENVEFNDSGFAPRLGLTYYLEKVGVFKFHYGKYFEYVGTGDYNNYARTIAFDEYRLESNQIGMGKDALALYVEGPLSYNPNYNDIDNLTMEFNREFVASYERSLFWNLAFESSFIYRYSSISWEEDINAVFSNGQFVDRQFPDYDIIYKRTHYKGDDRRRSDDYKGLQFQLKRNFTGKWGAMVNYSYMWRNYKRLMFDPGSPAQFVYSSPSALNRLNHGTTWTFHASAFYRLPYNFTISTFINGDSALWINDTTGDYAWDDSAPRVTLSNGRVVNDIVWQAKNNYYVGKKYGESGRYNDAYWTVNMRLAYAVHIQKVRVEVSGDMYNMFNWTAWRGFSSTDIRRDYTDAGGENRYQTKTSPQVPRTGAISFRIQF